ncbi:S49 family peptidase [Flexibacterium corallicola]|uniref:S49 family peptidase n=1 Tax=Flexibacterium corallicola TaxID=3037259 RepID=UPI00286F40EE|nr:S49 family peptidase [Pseudovibrio sp. M1P-2-3]
MLRKLRKHLPGKLGQVKPTVPVVRLQGAIGTSSTIMRKDLNLSSVEDALDSAFKMKDAPAVALIVNSPGGSPVQSNLIYKRIRSLAEEHDKDVLVFVEDLAASGGYMIALAGDDIYVDSSSIIGSIGVVSAGFGFTELINKVGIQRRVYTAGDKKVTLDPFSPENSSDIDHLKGLQKEVHETFIDLVKSRRGSVLSDDPDLFSGLFWAGQKAKDLGLVDDIGDIRGVLKKRYGKDTKTEIMGEKRGILSRVMTKSYFPHHIGSVTEKLPAATLSTLEERSLWARFGL